jgi:aryl-alcohol dehydrogenase-like predicted oxidoreductase
MCAIQLGLGLLSIGRQWGVKSVTPPSKQSAVKLIYKAYDLGIRFFDTAPAYGSSEKLLGQALAERPEISQNSLIASKVGEFWDMETNRSTIDHSLDGMCRSLANSLRTIGTVDILQLHKADTKSIRAETTFRFFEFAKSCGIRHFGASVSSLDAGEVACHVNFLSYLQFPFNKSYTLFSSLFPSLYGAQITPIINRPFAMGNALQGNSSTDVVAHDSFEFIKRHLDHGGVILTGTSKASHLMRNFKSFKETQP